MYSRLKKSIHVYDIVLEKGDKQDEQSVIEYVTEDLSIVYDDINVKVLSKFDNQQTVIYTIEAICS